MDSHILPPLRFLGTAAAVTLLVIAQLAAADAFVLSARQPWMDEIHTLELVGDPDIRHMLAALADGADFNPPGYYLIARLVTRLTGSSDPNVLRAFSLLCVVAGLTAIGLALQRHVRFPVSIVVVAALWSQTLLVDQSLEARFYAPWFAALAWLCLLMERERHSAVTIGSSCALATVVCSVHYFGVISLLLLAAGLVLRRRACIRETHVWLPTACGSLAIAMCYPFYAGQRAALTMSTWISPPNAERTRAFFAEVVPLATLGIVVAVAIASRVLSPNNGANDDPQRPHGRAEFLWKFSGTLSLLALPVVLLAFSVTIQPALVPRYSLVFLIGCAPLFAWMLQRVRLAWLVPVGLSFLVLGTIRTSGLRDQLVNLDQSRTQLVELLRQHASELPVAFENRIDSFPLVRLAGDGAANWYLVDFDNDELAQPSALRIVQRDVARRFVKWYPRYKTAALSELRIRERFFVVPYPDRATDDIDYGPFESRQVADRLYEMQRY